MEIKTILEEDRDLTSDKLRDHCLQLACEDGRHHTRVPTLAGGDERHQHLLEHAPAAWHLGLDPLPLLREMPGKPRIKQSGIFYEFPRLNPLVASLATESLRRRTVDHEKGTDPFHNSESEDVYDLYNACNGVRLRNGRLDRRKLEEYSPQEAEALNVARLEEVWAHTDSGCSECERIIRSLDLLRGTLREDAKEPFGEQTEAMDVRVIDSIS